MSYETAIDFSPLAWANARSDGEITLAPHLLEIDYWLREALAGREKRLVFNLAPGSAKTTLISKIFSIFHLEKHPADNVIFSSYASDFAADVGRSARNLFESWCVPPFVVDEEASAARRWQIAKYGGSMVTAGIGGQLTGRRANLFIVDDPFKDAEQALSLAYREQVWEWFWSVARSRLEPDGTMIVVHARWHQDDLSGRLENASKGELFRIVRFPAITESGGSFWPERFPIEALESIRASLPSYWWEAQWQQSPIARGGGMLDVSKIRIVPASEAPAVMVWLRSWDFAATVAKYSAFTAGVKIGLTRDGEVVFAHCVREKREPAGVKALVRSTAELDGKLVRIKIEEEGGSAGKFVSADFARELAGYAVTFEHPTGSKESRALPLATQVNAGRAYMIAGPWNSDFLDEGRTFPNGATRDQWDAASSGYEELASVPKLLPATHDPYALRRPDAPLREIGTRRIASRVKMS